jgi:hypothetical protein
MNTDILKQEILLFTGTNFTKRQLSENNYTADSNHLTEADKLEQACWSGLLNELLPEIIAGKELSLWKIGRTEFSLQIELSAYPLKGRRFSLDPYQFLNKARYN